MVWLANHLLIGAVAPTNPAVSVQGPKYVLKKGTTAILSDDEKHRFLSRIPTDTLAGLRDRAFFGDISLDAVERTVF